MARNGIFVTLLAVVSCATPAAPGPGATPLVGAATPGAEPTAAPPPAPAAVGVTATPESSPGAPAAPALPRGSSGEPPRLLVLPLAPSPEFEGQVESLDDLLLSLIQSLEALRPMGARDLEAVLGAEGLEEAAGCSDLACGAQLAGALDAALVMSGWVGVVDNQAVVSLQVLEVPGGRVTARAAARGGVHGDTLAELTTRAVEMLFDVKVDAFTGQRTRDYSAYLQVVNDLARLVASSDYSTLLKTLDRTDPATLDTPPAVDAAELFSFYRVLATFMLKGPELEPLARAHLERWPRGGYAPSVQSFLDQIDNLRLDREARADYLAQRLQEIDAREGSHRLAPRAAQVQRAHAHLSAKQYPEAAAIFAAVWAGDDWEARFGLIQSYLTALELAGLFAEARAVLAEAEQRDPKRFRVLGLHLTAGRLPR